MVKRFKLSFVVYIIHKPINNHDHVMFLAMAYHFFFQEVFCVSLTYAYQLSDQKEINFFLLSSSLEIICPGFRANLYRRANSEPVKDKSIPW